MVKTLLHAAGVACFGVGLYGHLAVFILPPHLASKFASVVAYPGQWKYLTVWDVVLQLAYHSVALINDIAGTSVTESKKQSKLQRFRDLIFGSLAFPAGMFVSITFWGLFALDRKLVLPKSLDEFFPSWLNHAVHTGPILFMLLESLLVPRVTPNRTLSTLLNTTFIGIYLCWVNWVHSVSNVWAYPILDVLNAQQRLVFFGAAAASVLGLYFMGDALNKWRWGTGTSTTSEKSTKKQKSKRA